jgi:hypothetical protein
MKNFRFIFNAILLITISISAAANAFGQTGGEILVEGNPPFTQSDFEDIVKYYERGLDIRFSDDERDELQTKISAMWRKNQKSNSKNLTGFMQLVRRLNTVPEAKIKANQQEFADALLGDLRTMSRNGWSDFVIKIYENAHSNESAVTEQSDEETSASTETTAKNETTENRGEPNFQPVSGAIKMSDLSGKWVKGSVSSYGYRNTITNEYKSGFGAANQHEISANGAFDYSNYGQVSGYGCTTELFTHMKGRATISGSQVTFRYLSGTVKIEDSCKKSAVTKPAQIKNTTYRVESDGKRLRLCEIGTETPFCIYREEK